MKVLIIGNGSTGVNLESNKNYINNHTVSFLNKISEKAKVGFSQFTTVYNQNSNLQNYDITESNISNHNLPDIRHPLFVIKLIRVLLQYDFIYIFYPGTLGTVVGLLSKILNKPYGLYVRGEYFNRNRFDKIVLSSSKFILTISPDFVPKLSNFCTNVEIIKPMISIKEADLKKDRNYKNYDVVKFLFVGRVEKDKGIYELLEIATQLKNSNHKFQIDIIGGGDLHHVILNLIEKNKLSETVFIHGQIADKKILKGFYDNADIFIFPSHHEGFPRVLYEAMASALPIFTTFVGGISGRMVNLENCIEIPVKDADASTKIISKYMSDISILEHVGKKGLETMQLIINGSLLPHENLLLKKLYNEK